MSTLAPIAVFAFNRPDHLRRTLSALSKNIDAEASHLHLFVDGPRNSQDISLNNLCIEIGKEYSKYFKGKWLNNLGFVFVPKRNRMGNITLPVMKENISNRK